MASCGSTTSKICLSVIGFIFWGAAAALIFQDLVLSTTITSVELKRLLFQFFALLLVVLTAEVTAGVVGYIFRKELHKAVHDGLEDAVDKYDTNSTTEKDQIDYLQAELKCCGIMNASDWGTAKLWQNKTLVPHSCCNVSKDAMCDRHIKPGNTDIYKDGCLDKLEKKFERNLVYIAGVAITFAIIQLLGMICSCILMCRSQEVRYEILGGPNSGLRV
ncbi:tetraspanin-3-like [Mercenaria mercenaria]|uniref:tetraspanin-3-like n=1 Tax=Mercenaria mercenaria TaxID=6596 RepID=UPI00234EA6D0|nr:tetraspanin-3-like [Mercenaria mercenaria]